MFHNNFMSIILQFNEILVLSYVPFFFGLLICFSSLIGAKMIILSIT